MGIVQVPDEISKIIARQIARGRAGSELEFVAEAVQRYADTLDFDEDAIAAAADEGLADLAAGRFELLAGPSDMEKFRADLRATWVAIKAG